MESKTLVCVEPSECFIGNIKTVCTEVNFRRKGIEMEITYAAKCKINLKWIEDVCSVLPSEHEVYIGVPISGNNVFGVFSKDANVRHIAIKLDMIRNYLSSVSYHSTWRARFRMIYSVDAIARFLLLKNDFQRKEYDSIVAATLPKIEYEYGSRVLISR